MVMTGAVGLVGMALVRAVEVGASITSVPTNGTIYFTRILNLGSQGSPRQTGCDVQKASDEHQGGVLAVGQPQAVASTPRARTGSSSSRAATWCWPGSRAAR